MTDGVANKVALSLASVAILAGWVDTLLYQQFIAREFPGLGYLDRNVQVVSFDKIMKYITSSPGMWVTLCMLLSGVGAFVVWRAGTRGEVVAPRGQRRTKV